MKENTVERVVTKLTVVEKKQLGDGQFVAVLSTDDLDRHGEHVSIQGMAIPKDQVIKMYYNHETSGANLPIGKWDKVWKSNGKLMGQGQIDMNDSFAVMVYNKIQNGFIDSISIGFMPEEYDGESSTWTKATLYEASVVAEPANINARITSKDLGFTEEEFKKSLKVKLAATAEPDEADPPEEPEPLITELKKVHVNPVKKAGLKKLAEMFVTKGGVADVLAQQDKCEEMEDFWEVVYAFSEAYYSPDAKVTDFTALLTECISILQTIADGNYAYEDEDENPSEDSGASEMPEIKSAIQELKSSVGALEAAAKASDESPAIKSLIKVRLANKQVDKANEALSHVLKVKLKETN